MIPLSLSAVEKAYGPIHALAGVDLELAEGEILGLLGPNGAGKTTLVSIVAGLRRPDAGSVSVCGIDVRTRARAARKHIGLAPQDTGVYPGATVRENLILFGELLGLVGSDLKRRVVDIADVLGLTSIMDRRAQFLSGGEKRRLHTGMALIGSPPLLLLDEPTSGVDVATRADVLTLVRGMAARGTAICYSTHYLNEVESLGASVAILLGGRLIVRGTLDALVACHGQSAVEFVFSGPAPDLSSYDNTIVTTGSIVRLATNDPAAMAARVLSQLGSAAERLVSVEIMRPSLESVFLALTGRRYEQSVPGGEDAVARPA
jgi:ABC-2 type transport system ATP-binding protein